MRKLVEIRRRPSHRDQLLRIRSPHCYRSPTSSRCRFLRRSKHRACSIKVRSRSRIQRQSRRSDRARSLSPPATRRPGTIRRHSPRACPISLRCTRMRSKAVATMAKRFGIGSLPSKGLPSDLGNPIGIDVGGTYGLRAGQRIRRRAQDVPRHAVFAAVLCGSGKDYKSSCAIREISSRADALTTGSAVHVPSYTTREHFCSTAGRSSTRTPSSPR